MVAPKHDPLFNFGLSVPVKQSSCVMGLCIIDIIINNLPTICSTFYEVGVWVHVVSVSRSCLTFKSSARGPVSFSSRVIQELRKCFFVLSCFYGSNIFIMCCSVCQKLDNGSATAMQICRLIFNTNHTAIVCKSANLKPWKVCLRGSPFTVNTSLRAWDAM